MSLHLVGLQHGYGRRRSLRGVTLNLERGDRYAFLGHNGAGKTTTLRIAAGFARPGAGRFVVDGFDAFEHPREARARIGALIEAPRFHAGWSGRMNLVALARLRGLGGRAARREADRVLEVVGMTEHGRRSVGGYSQGMRQRLGIAQSLLGEPRYVLLDEPLNGLDPEGIAAMRRLFEDLAGQGTGVLLSSHQLAEVAGFCNRVSVLSEGRSVCESSVDKLLTTVDRGVLFDTDAPERARQVLAAREVAVTDSPDGLRAELHRDAVAPLVQALVEHGVGVRAVVPTRPSLEQVYLQVARGEAGVGPAPLEDAAVTAARPAEARAPRWPLARLARYEVGRLLGSPRSWLLWLAPIPLALRAVWVRRQDYEARLAQLRVGEIFDVDSVTAFEGLGLALQVGVPVLMLVAVAVGSQSLAGELHHGTLRNVLLTPVRRSQVVLAKLGVLLLWTTVCFAALSAVAWWVSGGWFGVEDKASVFLGAADELEREPFLSVAEMLPMATDVLARTLPAGLACVSVGFLCGALVTRAVSALALALLAIVALDVLREPLANRDLQWLSPLHYLPSPLRDDSAVRYYIEATAGMADAEFPAAGAAALVPLGWTLAVLLLTLLVFRRRLIR